ncbi:stAR-related lipid transfer protein 5-like [Physella acuta]|uniref:stAR-related lipid transfer protein 5-like n=1 Tax=Physella acuta TaxID=109671 RepID=UPI0027DC9D98|nr:stAR-related lipid transfer protein 5-like [Physella acuta]
MPTDEELKAIGLKTADTLKEYLTEKEGWHTAKKTKDVLIEYRHSKCEGFEHGYLYRGQAEYHCSKDIIFRYIDPLHDDCMRTKWDKDITGIKILKQITPDLRICRSTTNSAAMGLISPRDFIDVILTIITDDCISTNGTSIEYSDCPPVHEYVRGWNHPCGMMCMSVPDKVDYTKLVTFIQPDIKGMIPRTLVDSALPASMSGFFSNLRSILKKDGHIKK